MEKYENLQEIIAENLIYYRKKAKLTQSQLAEKLNYSDKSISKWERQEGVPDVLILAKLAKIYGLTVNDFLSKKKKERIANVYFSHIFISLVSMAIIGILSTVIFVILLSLNIHKAYLAFIYGISACGIVMIVFNNVFFRRILNMIASAVVLWSLATALCLTLMNVYSSAYLLFIVAIPIQIFLVFLYILLLKRGKA